jgi:hypothetical protein
MALSLNYLTPDNRNIIYEMGSLQPVSSPILYRLMEKYGLHVGKNVLDITKNPDSVFLKFTA